MNLNLSKDAVDFLGDLQSKQLRQLALRIFGLQRNAYPPDAKHISGRPGYLRIDSGEYRVCYSVADSVVWVVVVGKRNDDEVYRQLRRKG
jgi:mRNA interferase RelE/StbE